MSSRDLEARAPRRARALAMPSARRLPARLALAAALLAGLAAPAIAPAEAPAAWAWSAAAEPTPSAPAGTAQPSEDEDDEAGEGSASASSTPAPGAAPTASPSTPADATPSATLDATPAPAATPTAAQAFAPAVESSSALLPANPVNPAVIACWGDSLSYHLCDPVYGAGGTAHLQLALGGGRTVVNHAVGSQISTEIATRMGAYTLTATFPGDVIPGSGSTRISVGDVPNQFRIFTPWVQINGVVGKLERSRSLVGEWTFIRAQAGAPVAVAPRTPIQMVESADRGQAGIIWVGRNNPQQPDRVIDDVARMVALHEAASDAPYWVVSVTPASYETTGTQGAADIARINAALASTYGDRYIPLDDYLRERGMLDQGMWMTAADRSAVARGTLPPSILDPDGLHFNHTGRTIIARYFASIVQHPEDRSLRTFGPQGDYSVSVRGDGVVQVVGWGFDRADLGASVPVTVTVDGRLFATATADQASDYLFAYGVPGRHGFWTAGRLSPGAHELCVTIGNLGAGSDTELPCRTVQVASTAPRLDPQGAFQVIPDDIAGTLTVVGWAFDHSNLYAQIPVEVTLNGRVQGRLQASMPTDYLAAYGVPGGHGFVGGYRANAGSHTVCVTAIDQAPGVDVLLGCQTVRLEPVNWNPEGSASISMGADGRIAVSGFAFDRSALASPLQIAIFQGGALTSMYRGAGAQPSLAPYGIPGPHGIGAVIEPRDPSGPSSFCVLAVNIGQGESTWLGCWDIDTRSISPQGAFAAEPNHGGGIRIDGWGFDGSVPLASLAYRVEIDGVFAHAGTANAPRRELATFFGWPGDHGFVIDLPSRGPGAHTICVTYLNTGRSAADARICQPYQG